MGLSWAARLGSNAGTNAYLVSQLCCGASNKEGEGRRTRKWVTLETTGL